MTTAIIICATVQLTHHAAAHAPPVATGSAGYASAGIRVTTRRDAADTHHSGHLGDAAVGDDRPPTSPPVIPPAGVPAVLGSVGAPAIIPPDGAFVPAMTPPVTPA